MIESKRFDGRETLELREEVLCFHLTLIEGTKRYDLQDAKPREILDDERWQTKKPRFTRTRVLEFVIEANFERVNEGTNVIIGQEKLSEFLEN